MKKHVSIKDVETIISPFKDNEANPFHEEPLIRDMIIQVYEEKLERENYEWKFQKTSAYWSKANYRTIAKDVAEHINTTSVCEH